MGRQYTVADAEEELPGTMLELLHAREGYYRNKITELLRIPGAVVAVNVRSDNVRREVQRQTTYMETEPLRRTSARETERRQVQRDGEPGVRSNAGVSIDSGLPNGTYETTTETEEEFGEKLPTQQVERTLAGQQVQQVNATVNVPRSYFERIYKFRNPDAEGSVPDAQLEPIVQEQLAEIEAKVKPVISAEREGLVTAHLFFDDEFMGPDTAGVAVSNGITGMLVSGGVDSWAAYGGLAAVAIGLMLVLVRRATQEEVLPSVEELAGIPPELPEEEELLASAHEGDEAMSAVEMSPGELRSRKIAEQIGELVKSSPAEAANLLGRWVQPED